MHPLGPSVCNGIMRCGVTVLIIKAILDQIAKPIIVLLFHVATNISSNIGEIAQIQMLYRCSHVENRCVVKADGFG